MSSTNFTWSILEYLDSFVEHLRQFSKTQKLRSDVNFTLLKVCSWFLNGNLTVSVIQVCMTLKVMFPSRNQRVLSSSIIIMIHVCARFCSAVPSGTSKLERKFSSLTHFHNTTFSMTLITQNLKSHSYF